MIRRLWVLLTLLPIPTTARAQSALPLTHRPQPTVPAITAGDLMTRLYIFAADSMEGREAGLIGNLKGTDYIAAELKRLGVEPAGEGGTYFQTIPLSIRTLDTTSTIIAGGARLVPFVDFVVLSGALDQTTVQVLFGGDVSDTVHRVAGGQAKGKLVVFSAHGAPSLRTLRSVRQAGEPAAYGLIGLDSVSSRVMGFLRRPQFVLDDPAAPQRAPPPVILLTSAAAAKLFRAGLPNLAPGAPGIAADIHVRFRSRPTAYPARNVVGVVRGSDAALRGEYVAIGAHNDHIGFNPNPVDHDSLRIWNQVVRPEGADDGGKEPTAEQQTTVDSLLALFRAKHSKARQDSISNGADDDGSGSVSVLEIAEHLASLDPQPKRSILFVWHTAEEKGLLGSRYFTDHPTVPRDSIVAQLNLDMVGRGAASDETGRTADGTPLHGGAGYVQLVGSHRLSTELGHLVETVNTQGGHHLTFDYAIDANGHPANIYCRSDHYEYARYGIPITFFTTGLHADYHQVTDEPEYISYEHMARVAELVDDIARHVADLDHRLVVDQPQPDPTAPCRQ